MWFWAVPLNVDIKFKWESEARFDACDSFDHDSTWPMHSHESNIWKKRLQTPQGRDRSRRDNVVTWYATNGNKLRCHSCNLIKLFPRFTDVQASSPHRWGPRFRASRHCTPRINITKSPSYEYRGQISSRRAQIDHPPHWLHYWRPWYSTHNLLVFESGLWPWTGIVPYIVNWTRKFRYPKFDPTFRAF